METTRSSGVILVQDRLPPENSLVLVVGRDFRCLGYLDRKGIWRDTLHQAELQDVIGWREISGEANPVDTQPR